MQLWTATRAGWTLPELVLMPKVALMAVPLLMSLLAPVPALALVLVLVLALALALALALVLVLVPMRALATAMTRGGTVTPLLARARFRTLTSCRSVPSTLPEWDQQRHCATCRPSGYRAFHPGCASLKPHLTLSALRGCPPRTPVGVALPGTACACTSTACRKRSVCPCAP